jgi:hypothetical protein
MMSTVMAATNTLEVTCPSAYNWAHFGPPLEEEAEALQHLFACKPPACKEQAKFSTDSIAGMCDGYNVKSNKQHTCFPLWEAGKGQQGSLTYVLQRRWLLAAWCLDAFSPF